ncbi:MAG TPA: hypothetical protein PKV43_09435, partial [Armatimonadota bacterium]|nr:hypothetical protein [Armatimonadota bacterium]
MHSKISRCSILVLLSVILTALLSFASYSMPTDAVSERVELRTETSKHWQNSDGTLTAEIFSGPVHYRDIDGAWKEIDTRLEPSEKAGFAHSATKNRFKSHLAADAKGRHAVELEGIEFAFTADVLEAALGTVEDSSITYANAWPDADLKYTVLPMGIKEDIILKSKPSVSQFRFIVKSGGLEPVTADRGINFVDKEGKVVVFIPGPFMIDANGAYSDAVEATWRSLSDGTVELLLEPDQEWLSKAVYPVVIDPTFYAATGTGAASMEATLTRLQQLYPPPTPPSTSYSWNYSNSYLTIGRYTSSPNTWTLYGCIKWDISSVPQNAVVEDTSCIELNKYTSGSTNKNLRLNKITQAWPPSARPISVSVLEQYFNGYVGTPDRFPSEAEDKAAFCQMVQGWIWDQSTNHGVEFEPVTGGDYNVQVWASEGSSSYCPKLVINYTLDEVAPAIDSISSPDCVNNGPIVINYITSDNLSGVEVVELWH